MSSTASPSHESYHFTSVFQMPGKAKSKVKKQRLSQLTSTSSSASSIASNLVSNSLKTDDYYVVPEQKQQSTPQVTRMQSMQQSIQIKK